ncbi:class I SAM-dependent methyltransferase [Candidatus Micrarchaeota archaeon]|nr:class I SAM-dependent methyltransferase [Candidatus Micrarchaeota archaeon]MBU1930653.1 class I SAM-dependent methyltransferase [Candidatus Micrarchaeota archaeon]
MLLAIFLKSQAKRPSPSGLPLPPSRGKHIVLEYWPEPNHTHFVHFSLAFPGEDAIFQSSSAGSAKQGGIFRRFDFNILNNPRVLARARALKKQADALHESGKTKKAHAILKEIEKLPHELHFEKRSPREWRDHYARQMPGDIAGPFANAKMQLLTSKVHGKVLEAMCGFNSFIQDASHIRKVVAADFSREMLTRYPYRKRKRVLVDFNFRTPFSDKEFDTISITHGMRYFKNEQLVPLFKEFRRILKPKGTILLIEGGGAGYGSVVKRPLGLKRIKRDLQTAGFSVRITSLVDTPGFKRPSGYRGNLYLIEATKNK